MWHVLSCQSVMHVCFLQRCQMLSDFGLQAICLRENVMYALINLFTTRVALSNKI